MEVDRGEVIRIAGSVGSESPEELADLLLELIELEYASRHHKRPNLVGKFVELIDEDKEA